MEDQWRKGETVGKNQLNQLQEEIRQTILVVRDVLVFSNE